jgi:hypothetical protein
VAEDPEEPATGGLDEEPVGVDGIEDPPGMTMPGIGLAA